MEEGVPWRPQWLGFQAFTDSAWNSIFGQENEIPEPKKSRRDQLEEKNGKMKEKRIRESYSPLVQEAHRRSRV